jgi:hypothetical protein
MEALFLRLCSEKVARHSGKLKRRMLAYNSPAMTDRFSEHYTDLLEGQYDCVDRIVLNPYFPLGQKAGGFHTWGRLLNGADETLDDTHLMRMTGRISRRVRAFAKARGTPVVFCAVGTRKHELAREYLAEHPNVRGVFMVLITFTIVSTMSVSVAAIRTAPI